MPSETFWTNGYVIAGSAPLLFGFNALLRPHAFYEVLQVAPPKDPEARALSEAQILMYGARNLTVGSAGLAAWYFGDRRMMGVLMLAGLPMAIIDGYAAQRLAGKGGWIHWSFIPVLAGIGAGCLGWI